MSDRCSPLPLRASLVRSSSTSSCRQALNGSRPVPPIPLGPPDPQTRDQQCGEVQPPRPLTPQPDQPADGKMHLDLTQLGALEQEEAVDHEEVTGAGQCAMGKTQKSPVILIMSQCSEHTETSTLLPGRLKLWQVVLGQSAHMLCS